MVYGHQVFGLRVDRGMTYRPEGGGANLRRKGIMELKIGEIEVIQYLRPNGRKRPMAACVGKDYVKKAEDMILSAEVLTTGEIAIYGRLKTQKEEQERLELAINGPGKNSPENTLKRIIDKVLENNHE